MSRVIQKNIAQPCTQYADGALQRHGRNSECRPPFRCNPLMERRAHYPNLQVVDGRCAFSNQRMSASPLANTNRRCGQLLIATHGLHAASSKFLQGACRNSSESQTCIANTLHTNQHPAYQIDAVASPGAKLVPPTPPSQHLHHHTRRNP